MYSINGKTKNTIFDDLTLWIFIGGEDVSK
jgi:hypothetical protein